jgi:hypothetical protein
MRDQRRTVLELFYHVPVNTEYHSVDECKTGQRARKSLWEIVYLSLLKKYSKNKLPTFIESTKTLVGKYCPKAPVASPIFWRDKALCLKFHFQLTKHKYVLR